MRPPPPRSTLFPYTTLFRSARLSFFFAKRMQLESAKEDLKPFGLQEDFSSRREDVETFVDGCSVDDHCNSVPVANTFDASPLAQGAFHIILAAGINEFLKGGVVL